jgi:hypothetical protein
LLLSWLSSSQNILIDSFKHIISLSTDHHNNYTYLRTPSYLVLIVNVHGLSIVGSVAFLFFWLTCPPRLRAAAAPDVVGALALVCFAGLSPVAAAVIATRPVIATALPVIVVATLPIVVMAALPVVIIIPLAVAVVVAFSINA